MYYYSKSEDKPYNRYNAIILTFEKSATQGGGPSWWTMKEGSKKFRTSGDFDYFSVAPIDREEKNDYSERTGRFLERFSEKLFDPCSSIQASEVKVEDSYQHLFGLAKEYEDNGDIFWRKTERLPYTFVSLVQFKGKHIDSAQLDELLIKYVNKFNDFQFRIFLSLEISDVIVFVKVGCYQDGLDCVNEMNDLNCYVYSMLGVESEMSLPEIVFASKSNGDLPETATLLNEYKQREAEGLCTHMLPCMKSAMREVFAAVSLLEKKRYARDVVCCVRYSFGQLVQKIKEANELLDNKEPNQLNSKAQLHDNLQVYVNGTLSIMQGILHADKFFFQIPGAPATFNTSFYNVPSKLLVFCLAFVDLVVKAFNDCDRNRYTFILNTGLHSSIIVENMFENLPVDPNKPENRFFEIKIPVSSLFWPKNLLRELIHEVAHCVGMNPRCRTDRRRILLEMIAERMLDDIETALMTHETNEDSGEEVRTRLLPKEKYNSFRIETYKYIYQYLSKNTAGVAADDTRSQMEIHVANAVAGFLGPFEKEAFINHLIKILHQGFPREKSTVTKIDQRMADYNTLACAVNGSPKNVSKGTVPRRTENDWRKIISSLSSMLGESFADLTMLMLSGIEKRDYLKGFYNMVVRAYGKDTSYYGYLVGDYTLERICGTFEVHFGESVDKYCEDYMNRGLPQYDEWLRYFYTHIRNARAERSEVSKTIREGLDRYLGLCKNKWEEHTNPNKNPQYAANYKIAKEAFAATVHAESLEEFIDSLKKTYADFVGEHICPEF